MRDVAVVAFAQSPSFPDPVHNDVETLTPVIAEAVKRSGIPRKEIGRASCRERVLLGV